MYVGPFQGSLGVTGFVPSGSSGTVPSSRPVIIGFGSGDLSPDLSEADIDVIQPADYSELISLVAYFCHEF